MAKTQTGRAIVHFPYVSQSTHQIYNSIILTLERASGKYGLPGGQVDPQKDINKDDGEIDTSLTAIRELNEELGLTGISAQKVYTYEGNKCIHDIYVVYATGKLNINPDEIKGIGFFNAGRHNQIPFEYLEKYVQELLSEYYGSRYEIKTTPSVIPTIPGFYFTGNKDRRIMDWLTQRALFKAGKSLKD